MRFLLVDQITRRTRTKISGLVRFGAETPLRYARSSGAVVVAPGAVSEAIGQLASWLCLEQNDFAARPVFLFADGIRVDGDVPVGCEIELEADVTALNDETFVFSGKAVFNGEVVQSIENCNGYFMPLGELEDPTATRARFGRLVDGGIRHVDGAEAAFPFEELVTNVAADESGDGMRATAHFAPNLPFYEDHFPRFPVTPIVMLNEAIGAAAARFLAREAGAAIRIKAIRDIKIRTFVKPGETIDIKLTVAARTSNASGVDIETVVDVTKDQKRIMRGLYEYHETR